MLSPPWVRSCAGAAMLGGALWICDTDADCAAAAGVRARAGCADGPALHRDAVLRRRRRGLLSFVLFGFTTFVTGVLPRGAAALLVLGALLLALFNFGDARIWLGVPFGLAWLWLGYALWSLRGAGPATGQ